jgi:hypothetical protein
MNITTNILLIKVNNNCNCVTSNQHPELTCLRLAAARRPLLLAAPFQLLLLLLRLLTSQVLLQ